METYSTFEYAEIKYEETEGKERANPEESKLYLNRKSIEYLEKLNIAQVFRSGIKFQNYVGVVSFRDLRLEILPKFMRTGEKFVMAEDVNNRKEILSSLVKMLEYSGWGGIKSVDLTRLGEEDEFFEIYVYLFARNLSSLLKTKRDSSYIRNYDELRFVKGRIDFKRYGNPARLHKIPCHYFERSIDTTINRTLKYVSYLLTKNVRNRETRRLLQRIPPILEPATLAPVSISEIDRITFNRLNSSFEPYINFCKTFLQRSVLSFQGDNLDFFSFLIPMEILFERFIAKAVEEIVENEFKNYILNIQKKFGHLARIGNTGMFALQPDIVLFKDNSDKQIIDTKYKLLNPEERKLGISQQDLYQMYAYCRELNSGECVLLYPEGVNGAIERDFKLGKNGEINLHVRTISLVNLFENGRLSTDFKKRLKEAIGLNQITYSVSL